MMTPILKIDNLILIAETALVSEGFRTLSETLDRICFYVHDLLTCVDVQIRTLDEEGVLLRVGGHAGLGAIAKEVLDEVLPIGDETVSALIVGRRNPSVEVYRTASPILVPTSDYRSDSQTFRSLTAHDIGSTYFAPIIREARVVGVLACYRRETDAPTDEDRELIALICRLTAISLATARIADESKRISLRLEEVQSTLETDNLTLRHVQEAQGMLIQALAEGGATTLEQVARTLASTIDRSVIVVDRSGSELAIVSDPEREPTLRRAVKAYAGAQSSNRRQRGIDDCSVLPLNNASNGTPLGALMLTPVIEEDEQFVSIIARQAGLVIAAHLQAKDADAALSSSAKPFALLALCHGIFGALQIAEAQGLFGLPSDAEVCLAAVKTSSAETAFRVAQRQTGFNTIGWPVLSAVPDGDWVLILLRGSAVPRNDLRRLLASHPQALAVGMSSPLRGLAQLQRGLREATRAGQFAAGGSGVACFADLGIFADLATGLPTAELRDFVESKLGVLRDYDRSRDARLIQTLDTFVRADCMSAPAARELGIHVNTLHQRLRRIESLADVDLKSVRDVAQLMLALDWAQIAWVDSPD